LKANLTKRALLLREQPTLLRDNLC